MKSKRPGPFSESNTLHHTDTHFWPNVHFCGHGPLCRLCCWEYLPYNARRSREEQRQARRAPSFNGRIAQHYAWELFHGESIGAYTHVHRTCQTLICANPHHLDRVCDQSALTASSEHWTDDLLSRYTCPHIAQP